MADKKKKKQTPKKVQGIKRVEEVKNPKLPKEKKIPKGSNHTIISKEGNIILTSHNIDISSKKSSTKKTAMKKPEAKKASVKKVVKAAVKKPAKKTVAKKTTKTTKAAKTTKADKALKHDEKFERGTDSGKIIILKSKKAKEPKKPSSKELKRVSGSGFTAWDGRTGKTFATEREAKDYAIDHFLHTGEMIPVSRTQRQVTHSFKAVEDKKDK